MAVIVGTRGVGLLPCVLLLTAVLSVPAMAAGNDRPQLQITRTAVAPVIDGFVDEALWEQAALIETPHSIQTYRGTSLVDTKPSHTEEVLQHLHACESA